MPISVEYQPRLYILNLLAIGGQSYEKEMKIKSVLKFISSNLLLFLAMGILISLVAAVGVAVVILLSMIGSWIGIDEDIFIYFAMFCICCKAWEALAWIVGKIADRIERKKEREYFKRLHEKK